MLNHIFGGNLTKPSISPPTPVKGEFTTIAQPALINPSAVSVPHLGDQSIFSYWANWLKTSMASTTSSFDAKSVPNVKFPGTIESISSLNSSGFDTEGFIYYPSSCLKGKKCPIHVVFHGCSQGLSSQSLHILAFIFSLSLSLLQEDPLLVTSLLEMQVI